VTKHTVPANAQTILRYAHVYATSQGFPSNITLSVGADAVGTRAIWNSKALSFLEVLQYFGSLVLEAGEILQATSSVNNVQNLVLAGDVITDQFPLQRVRKRLVGPVLLATSPTTVYTCPANRIAVVRRISIQCRSNVVFHFIASIGADATSTRIFSSQPTRLQVLGPLAYDVYLPLVAGEILQIHTTAGSSLDAMVDGEEHYV
jgi:hypothetical protein